MPTAQTPAEHLPLVFQTPPGWPTPTLEWVTMHLGWQPPPGWVPVAGCPHSPPRWPFWVRNDAVWARMARPQLRAARRNLWAGILLCSLAAGFTVYGFAAHTDVAARVVVALALLTMSVKTWQARLAIRAIEADLLVSVRDAAARLKLEVDRAHYERYLRSNGESR